MTHVYVVAVVIIMSAKDEMRGSGVKIKRSAGEEVSDRRLGYPSTGLLFRRPLFV